MTPTRQDKRDARKAEAIATAMEALGLEIIYTNQYQCDDCEVSWEDQWTCACDDDCPECGVSISPYDWTTNIDEDDDED
jgi:hypothetical protein